VEEGEIFMRSVAGPMILASRFRSSPSDRRSSRSGTQIFLRSVVSSKVGG
jgi:hypothetical protein